MAIRNVRILGRTFVVTRKPDPDNYGTCDKVKAVLNVAPGQDVFGEKDTLLHEIMHGILHQQGFNHAYKLEESFVRPLATGIMTVLQDNPALAAYLISKK